jgi:hypothetical protein
LLSLHTAELLAMARWVRSLRSNRRVTLTRNLAMRCSTIIATCLVNSNMINRLADAERAVELVFYDEFPHENFAEWNREINEGVAGRIINKAGRASRINVRMFIDDLRG